jgi:predicted kinase
MKYLKEFNNFLNEEWSKNEPIPEILDKSKGLAIFLIGTPGIGKSYFVNKFIHPKNPNIKDFSTDDVSLLFTKDPNVYYRGKEKPEGGRTSNASQLNLKKIQMFMTTGNSFIYDTTGAGKENTDKGFEHIKEMFDIARENKYEIVFIHLLSTLQTSINQDKMRDRHVDTHYIEWAYAKQMGGIIDGEKVEGNLPRYKALGPDHYYVILSIDRKYSFFKFIDGKLARKKGDKYVPMNESASEDSFSTYDLMQWNSSST